jgi:hypothetical protein
MSLSKAYPNHPRTSTVLTLDTIIAAATFFAGKWCHELKRNQSRDVLRLLLYKLYAAPGGSLFHRHARSSHIALANSLNLSRVWTCELIARLRLAGWLETSAPRLPNGKQEVSTFRPGRMLKRLIIMLLRSKERSHKSRVNDKRQQSPTKEQVEKNRAFLADLIQTLRQKLGRTRAERT